MNITNMIKEFREWLNDETVITRRRKILAPADRQEPVLVVPTEQPAAPEPTPPEPETKKPTEFSASESEEKPDQEPPPPQSDAPSDQPPQEDIIPEFEPVELAGKIESLLPNPEEGFDPPEQAHEFHAKKARMVLRALRISRPTKIGGNDVLITLYQKHRIAGMLTHEQCGTTPAELEDLHKYVFG